MESFNGGASEFITYNPSSEVDSEDEFSGLLEIYVHHARNIHNICIYDNQDVYAKFSLTYSPDETISTRVINGGGKNPDFNQTLNMKINQLDAVLKCEIWMLSRARNYLEDQLLGFALVPMSLVAGMGKVTQDFTLSSTDLFHSPAGTVHLTLFLNTSLPATVSAKSSEFSISSEVVLLNRKVSEVGIDPVEYGRIEFPDVNVARENQQMVSEYFNSSSSTSRPIMCGAASFLHLGALSQSPDDYDMTLNSSDENGNGSENSPNGSTGFFDSTTTSLSDDRNSSDSMEKKNQVAAESLQSLGTSPETPTSMKESNGRGEKSPDFSNKEPKNSNPLGNINIDAEQTAMQKQIVDMYMRSMQQFTESLAKMKLPMDLDKPETHDHGDVIQQHNKKIDLEKKKDGSRVFYGSRAFF
ncbi:hypothetical protein ACHQM5_019176 [Ranunculus cassubicifolius]